jgi:hypothetical protein
MGSGVYDMAMGVQYLNLNGSAPRCDHVDSLVPTIGDLPGMSGARVGLAQAAGVPNVRMGGLFRRLPTSSRPGALRGETDHPLAAELGSGKDHRWCYVHQRDV